jgi:hypothetical protein
MSKHSDAVRFFRTHAGSSYGAGETPAQGRERCARALARAEREGTAFGWFVQWEQDYDADASWLDEDCYTDEDRSNARLMSCYAYDADGACIGSLHSIHEDKRDEKGALRYRRVVRAELFSEALAELGGEAVRL